MTSQGKMHGVHGKLVGIVCLLVAMLGAQSAGAQTVGDPLAASYITPFPANDVHRVYVFGDSLAAGLAQGLDATLGEDPAVEIVDKSAAGLGIARSDGTTWDQIAADLASVESFHIAVGFFGVDDRDAIKIGKKWAKPDRPEWADEYAKRVDQFIKVLTRKSIAVYMVGLPIMRSNSARADAERVNEIIRERALANGVRYVVTWDGFVDAAGEYTDYGPDMQGKVRQLRAGNGISFTDRGYEKLAHFVDREISRDLAIARRSKDVPLAGDEEEQERVRLSVKARAEREAQIQSGVAATGSGSVPEAAQADYAADNSTITVSMSVNGQVAKTEIEIVRPAIPGAVVTHLLRSSASRLSEIGQTMQADLNGGLTALSSVASAGDQPGAGRMPLTQSPYYKVLVKGEPLPPRRNRADDFHWPRDSASSPSG